MKRIFWVFLVLLFSIAYDAPAMAQADCGVADRLDFPIDRANFTQVQDFASASSRHQGRYHTGEDWYGGRNTSFLKPVKAIADGRVTFSNPTAWGRDGGVVILEHQFTDGTTVYSMYGHMTDQGAPFPERSACVTVGQIIGAIGDVRPAPHLHFEIRTTNPDTAGAGYERQAPESLGYLRPSEFIINEQSWLRPSNVWHVAVKKGLSSPPLVLNDNSLLFVDGQNTIRRLLPDGRILWRQKSDKQVVSLSALQGTSLVTFADGSFQTIELDEGLLGERWKIDNFAPIGAPFALGNWLIYPAQGDELVAIDDTRRMILWRVATVQPFQRTFIANEGVNAVIGLVTNDHELLQVAGSGVLLSRTLLRYSASLSQTGNGDLLAYTWGGVWQVSVDGQWREFMPAPHGSEQSAILRENGQTYLFDGAQLHLYGGDNGLQWTTPIAEVNGAVDLVKIDRVVLLVSTNGIISAINAIGQVCNQTQVYGRPDSLLWHNMGTDGILRVGIGEQILGIDWARFTQSC